MFRRLFAPRPIVARPYGPRRQLMRALRSPNPNHRRRAINVLGTLNDPFLMPQAVRMLEMVAQSDPDPELRALAQRYVDQLKPGLAHHPGATATPAQPVEWTCEWCSSTHLTATACPNCGAPRP